MRPSPRLGLVALAAIGLVGCSVAGPVGLPSPVDGQIVVREGLPHPVMEATIYQAEKDGSKPKVEIAGDSFYEAPLTFEEADRRTLLALVNDPETFAAFSGEKKCGGFHPDYAIEWSAEETRRTLLLCFGCSEAKLVGPGGTTRFDLGRPNRNRLRSLIYAHRTNRPEPGQRK